MNKNNIWLITAKTNLHVGNENTSNYGLIDKAIQRDVLTGLPCINSSSLKGALNEFCCYSKMNQGKRREIFGNEKQFIETETEKKQGSTKGKFIFFDAKILFLPQPIENDLYRLVTCPAVLDEFRNKMKLFGITLNENNEKLKEELKKLLHIEKEIKIDLPNEMFIELCDDINLPIIARNVLENGQSKNLWYEQILPSETVLYTLIDNKEDPELTNVLKSKNAIVQIGANATIGYGYCKFTNLND